MVLCGFLTILIISPLLTIFYFFLIARLFKQKVEDKKQRWDFPSRNKLIVHGPPRLNNIPNLSPFVLKLETFLKAVKIPYEFDSIDFYPGPKRQIPWISYNGQHMGDSNLIIEFLQKEFKVDLGKINYSDAQLASVRAISSMLEHHYFHGMAKWRIIDGVHWIGNDVYKSSFLKNIFLLWPFQMLLNFNLWLQGLGLHEETEFIKMMEDDLRILSSFLGDKKYLLGDSMVEEDCTAFAFISETILRLKYSPYERLINEELLNLKEYFDRVKGHVWPDWNQYIVQN